ncbi:hypothetical protein FBU30_000482 [Linnemannia zychae]|nr:hypothetical protein FBU30_000482 [Linnemannia zychae]
MARSPAKSKSMAIVLDGTKKTDSAAATTAPVSTKKTTTTTTTTTVAVVDEAVVSLDVAASEEETKEEPKKDDKRELPIFKNPLLADENSSAVTLKPKAGRVKVQGGKTATIAVLKMSAPKVDGEVVVMRRMDSNLVNASLMFQAAFPAATEQWITRENTYLTETYGAQGAVVENSDGGALAGVWITISQAKELSKEYGIEQFMLPLLNAPARKNTLKGTTTSSPSPSIEAVSKDEKQIVEKSTEVVAAVVATEDSVVTKEETVVVEQTVQVVTEDKTVETLEVKVVEKVEKVETEEKNDQEQEPKLEQEQKESSGSKRRREEDEEQAEKDRKRFRNFVTVAVGLAAVAAAVPQVLPYFS